MESRMVDREAVKTRFQNILQKVASDQALWNKIKDRSVLGAIFANNTRDLAAAGIKGNELISELSNVVQDALLLINQGMLQKEELIKSVDVLRGKLEQVTGDFAEMFKGVFSAIIQSNTRSENNAKQIAMHNWNWHVRAAKESEFNKGNKQLCLLELAYDCLSVVREKGIDIGEVNIEESFRAAWKDLGMDADAKFSVGEFVSGLCEDVGKVGLDRLDQITTIEIAGEVIPPEYILKNVSGAGCSAVCQFAVDMGIAKHLPLEVAKEALLKHINESADKGSVVYTAERLAVEIISECLAVEKLFCEEHGLAKVETRKEDVEETEDNVERTVNTSEFGITDALGGFVAISDHAFLATSPSQEDKKVYLESFALVFAACGGYRESNYLVSMAKLFGIEDSFSQIKKLTLDPKIDIPSICKVLASDVRKYTWCVDAMFIGNELFTGKEGEKPVQDVRSIILEMCKVFGFKVNEIEPFIDGTEALATAGDPISLFTAIKCISLRTDAWRSVVDFKRISLKGAFGDLHERLRKRSCEAISLSTKVTLSSCDLVNSCGICSTGDENLLERTVISMSRSLTISKFKELKKEVEVFEKESKPLLSEANSILALFKTKAISIDGCLNSIEPDDATSVGNDNWVWNMNDAFTRLSDYASNINWAIEKLDSQLTLYEEGRYLESVEENAKKAFDEQEANEVAPEKAPRPAKIKVEKRGARTVIKME